ncbi:MAG: gag-polyprotein putative aspartyl protease [Verrucomicrobiota bacterium]|jgi:predicted aspartyl protease
MISTLFSMIVLIDQPLMNDERPVSVRQNVKAQPVELPFLNSMPALAVEINGVKGCLVLDTGATDTVLSSDVIDKLKIAAASSGKTATGVGGKTVAIMSGDVKIKVPGSGNQWQSLSGKRYFMPLPAKGEAFGAGPFFGVIGLKELIKEGVVINCYQGSLEVRTTVPPSPQRQMLQMYKIPAGEGFQWGVMTILNGKKCVLMVDTAASITAISQSFMTESGITLEVDREVAGAGGSSTSVKEGKLPSMILGKCTLTNVPAVSLPRQKQKITVQGQSVEVVGILGIDQLQRCQAIFDCAKGQLHVSTQAPLNPSDYPSLIDAVCMLARKGDPECQCIMNNFLVSGSWPLIALKKDEAIVARAKEKGYYKPNLPDTRNTASPSGSRAGAAIQALAAKDDPEAKEMLDDAKNCGGKLYILPAQAAAMIKRASEQGLLPPEEMSPQLALRALQALAQAGDIEAKKFLSDAVANGGRLNIDREKAIMLIEKAREKGLLP